MHQPQRPSVCRDQTGGAPFIEILLLIGLFCFGVAPAMKIVGQRIFETFRDNAEATEASSLGSDR